MYADFCLLPWAKFMSHKKELCGRCYPLRDRLKLFNATVTPTVLYGCGSWTMTKEREQQLRTAQRKMLRWIVGVGRQRNKGARREEEGTESEDDEHPEPQDDEEGEHDDKKKMRRGSNGFREQHILLRII